MLLLISAASPSSADQGVLAATPSPFYRFTVIAKTGQTVDIGTGTNQVVLTGFGRGPSINKGNRGRTITDKSGDIAFVGKHPNGEGVFTWDGSTPLRNVNPSLSMNPQRAFAESVQINNKDVVVTHDRVSDVPSRSFIRLWNAVDSYKIVASGGGSLDPFDSVYGYQSFNNISQTVFGALKGTDTLLATLKPKATPPYQYSDYYSVTASIPM